MTLDLDAIRARDAESPHFVVLDKSIRPSDWEVLERLVEPGVSAMRDRRDLLAEVDRLRALVADQGLIEDYMARAATAEARANILADAMVDRNIDRWDRGVEHERARALPVIEAARKVVERVLPDSPALYGPEMSDHIRAGNDALTALRAALAEYDR